MITTNPTHMPQLLLAFVLALVLTLGYTFVALAAGPGDLDPTFNGTGVVTTTISSGEDTATSVAVQPDGKIVVAGSSSEYSGNSAAVLARYEADGSLDTSFNGAGTVFTPITNGYNDFASVALQSDGKIIVAGTQGNVFPDQDFALMRFNPDGTLDSSFNNTGIVTSSIGLNDLSTTLAIQQPENKIIVAGNSDGNMAIVRYNDDGSLDTDFNSTGIVTTSINNHLIGAYGVTVRHEDGKIIVSGSGGDGISSSYFIAARYNSNGSLDNGFNATGIVTTSVGSNSHHEAYGLAVQPDGGIIIAGYSTTISTAHVTLVRYTVTGSLDSTFSNTGIVTTVIGSEAAAAAVMLQPDGKILAAGVGGGDFAVVRYNNDGSPDLIFNGTGVVTTSIGNHTIGRSVALQPDGKIVVAGVSDNDFALARYIGDAPDLTLTKTVNDDTPDPGQTITYTVTLGNQGWVSMTNATLSDPLPPSLSLAGPLMLDPPGSGLINIGSPVLVTGLTITPGNFITLTYPVTVNTAGVVITNVATVTSTEVTLPVTTSATISAGPDTQPPTFPNHHLTGSPLITPTQGITIKIPRPVFDWTDAVDNVQVISYTLTLTHAGTSLSIQATTSITTTQSVFTPTYNLPNGLYHWTVRAYDAVGHSTTVASPASFAIQVDGSDQKIFLPVIVKDK